jgi:cation/acetate symporter
MSAVVVGAGKGVQALPLLVFGVVLSITLGITFWAARRTRTATDFWAAGRGISGLQNGLAIAGDYMSAAAFLGVSGLIFLFGFDGFITGVAALVSFIPVLMLLAERMRNAGKYTMADVLAYRLRARPARTAAATGTLAVVAFYLIAQMIAAGALIQALAGLDFAIAVVITGTCMLTYVLFGGMLATTWVQIIKAVLLLLGVGTMAIWVLSRYGFDPFHVLHRAAVNSKKPASFLGPGLFFKTPWDTVSTCLAFALGTAGLPHILMRFFTVPNAKVARGSVGWAVVFIGIFYLFVSMVGFGAVAVLGEGATKAVGKGGNLAAPLLAQGLGGGKGTVGGDVFFAAISGIAFATILAVVSGLVISASGAVAHDLWTNVIRPGRSSDREEVRVGRIAAASIGVIGMALAILAGPGFNIQFLVSLAFAVAASANFPALLLAVVWRRFTTVGALSGVAVGLVSSITLIVLSPAVWSGAAKDAPVSLTNPAVISIPLAFLACIVGSLLSNEPSAEDAYAELRVRAESGIGAELAGAKPGPGGRSRRARSRRPTTAPGTPAGDAPVGA